MASHKYLTSVKESGYTETHVDVVRLMHKAKFETKKEKIKLVLISSSALFALIVTSLFIAI